MKSKSLNIKTNSLDNNLKAYDFIRLYKSAAETTAKLKTDEEFDAKIVKKKNKDRGSAKLHKHNKKNGNSAEVPQIASIDESHYTSKSIIKNVKSECTASNNTSKNDKIDTKSPINISNKTQNLSRNQPKKRNKSVSFMLDDTEEVAVKKTKSESSAISNKNIENSEIESKKSKGKKFKKSKKNNAAAEKENVSDAASPILDEVSEDSNILRNSTEIGESNQDNIESKDTKNKLKKKKNKELNKLLKAENLKAEEGTKEAKQNFEILTENKIDPTEIQASKKSKKKKHSAKPAQDVETSEGEPSTKSRKKDIKPDVVADGLGNLNIGDNTHTLTNLLDEMAVVDKKKQKKNKHKQKKGKHPSTPTTDLEGGKEKEKWTKKRWNKEKKPIIKNDKALSSILVENLPVHIMLDYKKLLIEHFSKCGTVKKVGILEAYLTESPKPVFTTTISFDSDDAALKALEEDNTPFEGNFIRVKQLLPPTETTLVVRSYGDLNAQTLSSTFMGAGRIRNIRHLVKGKKSMATAFIEFDGPLALDRAIEIATDVKIGGKRIYVSRFEFRTAVKPKQTKMNVDDENDGNNESSID